MIKVTESKQGKESIYLITEEIAKEKISTKEVRIICGVVKNRGVNKYLLYNSKYELVSNAYDFLNKRAKNHANNTKRNYMYALKFLYVYLEIFEKDLLNLKETDLYQLSSFLKGVSSEGSDFEYNLITKRSNKTISIFFSAYREFFKHLGLKENPLLRDYKDLHRPNNNSYFARTQRREIVPEYISEDEYSRIMKLLKMDTDIITLRNKCIIRLMYESGLRLGEVLGLTFEDINLRTSSNGSISCVLLIRNRCSNRDFQQAKTCMKVYDKRNYGSNDYQTRNVGFQEAIIFDFDGISTFEMLSQYIDLAHDNAEKYYEKKYMNTVADSVGDFSKTRRTNRYLFLNSKGGVLSDEVWNQCLRKIFNEVGISIDYGYRKNNLSHRFRHAFAMKLMYGMGNVNISAVKTFTRHKSDDGLNAYNNPTTEDIVKIKDELVAELGIVDLKVKIGN